MMYKVNRQGCIVNQASRKKITSYYSEAIDEIIGYYRQYLGEDILSIYIRGSVPLGRAKKMISDIDMIAVTRKKLSAERLKWTVEISKKLRKKYSQVEFFDLTTLSVNELLHEGKYRMLKFHLKTSAARLWGKNLSKRIKNYHTGKSLINDLYPHFDKDINDLKKLLVGKKEFLFTKKPLEFWCVWIMRDILRAGGAFATAVDGTYTRDLKDCRRIFNIKYPQYKKEMDKALKWALKPISNKSILLKYLNSFSPKLILIWGKILNK